MGLKTGIPITRKQRAAAKAAESVTADKKQRMHQPPHAQQQQHMQGPPSLHAASPKHRSSNKRRELDTPAAVGSNNFRIMPPLSSAVVPQAAGMDTLQGAVLATMLLLGKEAALARAEACNAELQRAQESQREELAQLQQGSFVQALEAAEGRKEAMNLSIEAHDLACMLAARQSGAAQGLARAQREAAKKGEQLAACKRELAAAQAKVW
jgi:hypothetical protein